MSKLTCPSCHQPAMSSWGKLNLSPIASQKCSKCKVELTVPFIKTMLCLLPTSLPVFLLPQFGSSIVMYLIPLMISFSFYLIVNHVPLIMAK
ncbi:hypothetical protein [Parashewanella curva]|uniref:hypothetical protein n=1 Tax=Parashewanella curva TaxID=2338552 RepID=UPI0010598C2A|nr:hypothetical protein [Parashewanella curva]